MVLQVVVKQWWQKQLRLNQNLIFFLSKGLNCFLNMLVNHKKPLETYLNELDLVVLVSYFLMKSMLLQLKDLLIPKFLKECWFSFLLKWMEFNLWNKLQLLQLQIDLKYLIKHLWDQGDLIILSISLLLINKLENKYSK